MEYRDMLGETFRELHQLMKDWDFPKTPDTYEEFYEAVEKASVIGIYQEGSLEAAVILFATEDSPNILWVDVCASEKFRGNWATKRMFKLAAQVAEEQGKTHFGIEAMNPISHIAAEKAGFAHIEQDTYMVSVEDFKKKWRI